MRPASRSRVTLSPIGMQDVDLVDATLDQLQRYSMLVDGVPKMTDGAVHLLTATPPGRGADAKYVFAVLRGSDVIGIVDLIRDFPTKNTAFIGLLAIVEPEQRRGFGAAAVHAIEEYARERLAAQRLRLAVVAANPVEGFWKRMGFSFTGEERPYSGERVTSRALLMEKDL